MAEEQLEELFANTKLATLVTLKRDGRPQISNIMYRYDSAARQFKISITADRAKTKNMQRDPRVSLSVNGNGGWNYAVAEGQAELSPVASDPHDATVEELVEYYRAANGEHPDWDEYRQAMVNDHRLVLTVHVERFYGMVRGS
ncbi:PPOX class F420-dependent oxidoreductase [Antrihabitans stalactiti]|uniref:PPOX class F420-dependent oxidoreductase n=1 Tax=Antrihabitans stalactiti TaxID=2584121 RepID=A0A848KHP4_9NOCA|nr:PPOX class F420-dependent oxidoreductase [Antrihabitans stalactiti]NMN97681.1 PPOX class F420-dependent oxidoreductase [Antrihabitans stalactiti]